MSAIAAEWVKLRTVRGWVLALIAAAAAIVGIAIAPGRSGSCDTSACTQPTGPGGEAVSDSFYFVHQPLTGDGTLTVRVAALTGSGWHPDGAPAHPLVPWAKAGIIVKASLNEGSPYAAVMRTGAHGLRMQYDYTGDIALGGSASARWLRLARHGDTLSGYASADGMRWEPIGSVVLRGLPVKVQAGLFVTSPQFSATSLGQAQVYGDPTAATATFTRLGQSWAGGEWTGTSVGAPGGAAGPATGYTPGDGGFTVTGSGDIGPAVSGASGLGVSPAQTLNGTFLALILLVVVGAMVMTAEYRRGLIRVTLAALPRRSSVLLAKAAVLGGAAFLAGLAGCGLAVPLGLHSLRAHGVYVAPASWPAEVRMVAGSALVLALVTVLATAIGAVLRRGAAAVAAVVTVIVLPYLFAVAAPVLPLGALNWLMRVTPAAAFAVQQTEVQYPQVDNVYAPSFGYYPLAWWAGLLVLCAWVAVSLGAAIVLLGRRDA